MAIGERKTLVFENPFCKIIGRCGENVGKILYKNGLQVSVGHLRVPGAGAGFLNLSSPRVNLMECCGVDKWL